MNCESGCSIQGACHPMEDCEELIKEIMLPAFIGITLCILCCVCICVTSCRSYRRRRMMQAQYVQDIQADSAPLENHHIVVHQIPHAPPYDSYLAHPAELPPPCAPTQPAPQTTPRRQFYQPLLANHAAGSEMPGLLSHQFSDRAPPQNPHWESPDFEQQEPCQPNQAHGLGPAEPGSLQYIAINSANH
eukprot:gb/GEZN01020230.1/.p1 GENE.gb/GEZN01020230.1/~~gb/GEZN01020230.1/.p1  ORF type:complete len:189 (-),score=1.30 gb/GEZN01020230.1/:71-637(-)